MSDQKNETRTEEIKTLLRARHYDVIHEEIIPYIRQVVAQEVDRQIETAVREVVAEELGYLVPDPLQIQIREHTEQLEEIQISLRNAEARRQNSLLRSTYLNDPLHPLLKPSGKVSPNFPRDLATLFELDGAAAKALNMEYGLQDVGDGREKNLNRFMQFIGVPYQMRPLYYEIRPRGSTPGVPAYSPDPKTELYSQIKAGRRIQALRMRGPMPTAKSPAGHTSLDQRSPTPLLSFTKEIEDYDVPLGTAEVPATREAIIHVTRGKALPPRDAFGVHFLSGVVAATGQLAALYLSRGGEGVY
ncbi:hypothetical protein FRB99_005110 [Tulasnella sp. 403]|nr:hypothetical protein FRB99_005110 [Tulasnella sp. 403]